MFIQKKCVISHRQTNCSVTMNRKILFFIMMAVAITACKNDKKQVQEYLDRNYADREVKVVGKITPDSAFCPLTKLEATLLEVQAYRVQLMQFIEQNLDSAYQFACLIKDKYADENSFANLAYPNGQKNRLAYRVRCDEAGEEHYITFYKNLHDDTIEYSSFDVEDIIDSISVYYNSLMNGVNSIVSERNIQPAAKGNKTDTAENDNEVDEKL